MRQRSSVLWDIVEEVILVVLSKYFSNIMRSLGMRLFHDKTYSLSVRLKLFYRGLSIFFKIIKWSQNSGEKQWFVDLTSSTKFLLM